MIDRLSPVALYEQVRRILEQQIASGVLAPGELLPSDADLCGHFGVSRITVTHALAELARQGLVDRAQGRRTAVRTPRVTRSLDELIGLTETLRRCGLTTHSQILSRRIVGLESLPEGFTASRRSRFVRIRRLRYVGEHPAVIATAFLPARLADRISHGALETESYYDVFERTLGRPIARREQSMVPVVADANVARLLNVPPHSAHFCVRGTTYLEGNELVELTESIFHGSIFEFRASLRRVRQHAA